MTIHFKITDQDIKHDAVYLVADNVNTTFAEFEFDEIWEGLDKSVTFKNGDVIEQIIIEDEEEAYPIPPNVLTHGKLYTVVTGYDSDGAVFKVTKAQGMREAITVVESGLSSLESTNNGIVKGTTPTQTFTFEESVEEFRDVLITYKQNGRIILEKKLADLTEVDENTLQFVMSQEESLKFDSYGYVEFQIRILRDDESADASIIYKMPVSRVLNDMVLE